MSLRINHNISSINGHRQLLNNNDMMAKSLERLSSGLRINRAADGAAGLVISEQMRAQITGLGQAVSNSETAVTMVQTTEGALDEVNNLLNKARELTLHALNAGANDTNQLAADQAELDNVITTISRISDVTQFGTKKLLNGSLNGATTAAGSGLSHIKVGNLANNAAITTGAVNVVVTGGIKESNVLASTGTTTDSYIFSAAVTGVNMGSANVTSGVTVNLTVGSSTVSYLTTGAMSASGLATQLTAKLSSGGVNYTASANANGQIEVQSNAVGSANFTSSISFSKATTAATPGTGESINASLIVVSGNGTASGAALAIFGGSSLSGVATTNSVSTGTRVSYTIDTATGGSFTNTYTVLTGETVASVLTAVQGQIQAHATFTGATLSLATGTAASGVDFKLKRGDDTIATDFNFSLSIDYQNNPVAQSEAHVLQLGGAYYTGNGGGTVDNYTFSSGGTSGTTAANLTGSTLLNSGSALNFTIDGNTFVMTGGQTLSAIATALEGAISGLGAGYSGYHVVFNNTGTSLSGQAGYSGITGTSTANSFVIYNENGSDFNVSLSIDQQVGADLATADSQLIAGLAANATLNLTTETQTRTSNTATVAAIAASTASSTAGGVSVVVSGSNTVATMTTANGVALNLVQSSISTSGAATMTLSTGAVDAGYTSFSLELSTGLTATGGTDSFTLNNGAEFQIGANALQLVGLVIGDMSADELGRGASSSLRSLEDMLSTNKGALLNGLGTAALNVIDRAIDEVTNQRGKLGAFQANTLESGLNSLRVSKENLTAAESTIRDVDFAEESANFTRNQILVQASTSMLAQANQMPQNVLKLLG
jgi:flagellin